MQKPKNLKDPLEDLVASMGRKAVDSLFGRKSAKHRSEKPKSLNDYITESNGLVRADKVGEWNDYLRDNTSTPPT